VYASSEPLVGRRRLILIGIEALAGQPLSAQTSSKRVISLAAADRIAAAAEARKRGATVVIVVVDDGGYPIVLRRLDDTQVASVDVGLGKARTAAIFRRPSKVFGGLGMDACRRWRRPH
jgi:glc operon protein GlcG